LEKKIINLPIYDPAELLTRKQEIKEKIPGFSSRDASNNIDESTTLKEQFQINTSNKRN